MSLRRRTGFTRTPEENVRELFEASCNTRTQLLNNHSAIHGFLVYRLVSAPRSGLMETSSALRAARLNDRGDLIVMGQWALDYLEALANKKAVA